jgi:hypothetical protein
VTAQGAVSFRGSLGAREYTIERQSAPDGPWDIIAEHFDETRIAYRPFVDPDPPFGHKVRYRVVATNETGRSEPVGAQRRGRHRRAIVRRRDGAAAR